MTAIAAALFLALPELLTVEVATVAGPVVTSQADKLGRFADVFDQYVQEGTPAIADIAQNHVAKVERRISPLIELANSLPLPQPISQPRLHSILARHGIAPAGQGAQSS